MEIRLFNPEEDGSDEVLSRLNQLFQETILEVNIQDYAAAQVQAWASCANFRDWQKLSANRFTFIAEEADEIIGFAELEANGHIDRFYCHKDHQRRGVGTRLYQTLETKAMELEIKKLYTEASITARAFFKSRGFAVIKEQQVLVGNQKLINFVMEKCLDYPEQIVIANFYHFVKLVNYQQLRPLLKSLGHQYRLKGTILLAPEGVNATIAGQRSGIDAFLGYLRAQPGLKNLEHKESFSHVMPLNKLRVRLKTELVKFGISGIDPTQEVGIYVEPQDWNDLIRDPDVLVIDTRNIYEVELGSFAGAINPNLDFFSEFPQYAEQNLPLKNQINQNNQKIAMFCTGGIRCEKASAYLLAQGYAQVYHLKGGILKYLETIPKAESLWHGECFIFDDRIVFNSELNPE